MDTEPTTTPPPSQNEDMAKALLMLSTILGRKNPEKDNLTAHFEEQAAEKDDPWKKHRAALRRRTKGWDEEFERNSQGAWEELRHSYGKAGYNQLLTEETALELSYLLCATPLQAYRRARALLQLNSDDRLALHNFNVGQANGETFMERWGPEINGLPVPLFPATAAHEDTNQKLLAQMSLYTSTVKGAGAERKAPKFNIFAKPIPISGAGHKIAVVDGQVDVGIVEEEFGTVNHKHSQLLARIEHLEGTIRNINKKNNNTNNYNNNTNTNRGRGNNQHNNTQHNPAQYYNNAGYHNQHNNTAYNNPGQYNNNNYYSQHTNGRGGRGTLRGRGGQEPVPEQRDVNDNTNPPPQFFPPQYGEGNWW